MRDVFISYVEENTTVAERLAAAIEAAGFSTWYYGRDSIPGVKYLAQIGEEIEGCKIVIVLVSEKSICSHQVGAEIERAFELGRPFIPVLVDLSHAEFQARQPVWRQAFGAATSIRLGIDLGSDFGRIVAGVAALLGNSIADGSRRTLGVDAGAVSVVLDYERRYRLIIGVGFAAAVICVLALLFWHRALPLAAPSQVTNRVSVQTNLTAARQKPRPDVGESAVPPAVLPSTEHATPSPPGKVARDTGRDVPAAKLGPNERAPSHVLRVAGGNIDAAWLSSDQTAVAALVQDGALWVWQVAQKKFIRRIPGVGGKQIDALFLPKGHTLAINDGDAVHLLDIVSGREVMVLSAPTAATGNDAEPRIVIWPQGDRIGAILHDGNFHVWRVEGGAEIAQLQYSSFRFEEADHGFKNAQLSGDGSRLALQSEYHTVLWNGASLAHLANLDFGTNAQVGLDFSPDGEKLVTANFWEQRAKAFEVASGREIAVYDGFQSKMNGVAYSRDGSRVLAIDTANVVKLWDTASGKCLDTLRVFGPVRGMDTLPGGRFAFIAMDAILVGKFNSQGVFDPQKKLLSFKNTAHPDSLLLGRSYSHDFKHAVAHSAHTVLMWEIAGP